MYKRLAKQLDRTRKSLWELCEELDIDYNEVDMFSLEKYVSQCTHCDIWTVKPIQDLDGNPICNVCFGISGL